MDSRTLIIVESPTKAKTIGKFLGGEYNVLASNGHIRALPENETAIDVRKGYVPQYVNDPAKSKVIEALRSAIEDAPQVFLATDEDREGESISWHITEVFKNQLKGKTVRRMVFHEITDEAIRRALDNSRDIDMNLVSAQEARRVLDRLYGFTVSPVLWSKLSSKSLSAGRVQSPGLKMIVEREKMRLNWRQAFYYGIKAEFSAAATRSNPFMATLVNFDGRKIATSDDFDPATGAFRTKALLLDEESAKDILSQMKGSSFSVSSVTSKQNTVRPSAPFTTSTLQQEADRKLRLSSKETMKLAQSLYEQGFITYHRTDSVILSEEGTAAARKAAEDAFGRKSLSPSPRKFTQAQQLAQEAHEAIRPAGKVFKTPAQTGLEGRELALYDLIWKRTLACQMANATKTCTTLSISDVDNRFLFSASETTVDFPGFMQAYIDGSDNTDEPGDKSNGILCSYEGGAPLAIAKPGCEQHKTKEPMRYTEASLIKQLEENGIGRPSTYAAIIGRLFDKNYIVKEKNSLIPTFTAFGIIDLLEKSFASYVDYNYTKDMEKGLDEIANAKMDRLSFLKDFFEGENGLEANAGKARAMVVSKDAKVLHLPQLSDSNPIILGPYGPYVRSAEGKCISVPEKWLPCNVTDEAVSSLIANGGEKTDGPKPEGPVLLGTTSDGVKLFSCTGKYGPYWQLGDIAVSKDVKRISIPRDLQKKEVPFDVAIRFFTELPRLLGKDSNGEDVTADLGKYGPYVRRGGDFRSVSGSMSLFSVTLDEALAILEQPKAAKPAKARPARKASK